MAEVLFAKSATVASVVEINQRKSRYAFEINVNWSNGGKSTCIKSYQEFFTVHCKLLDEFPDDAGKTAKSPRIIPFLPSKKIFRRSTKRLAQERLPLLNTYIQTLVSLPDHISCSSIVREFLEYETILNFVPEETNDRGHEQLDEDRNKGLEEGKMSDHIASYTDAINPSHSSHTDHGTTDLQEEELPTANDDDGLPTADHLHSTTINSHSVDKKNRHTIAGTDKTKQLSVSKNDKGIDILEIGDAITHVVLLGILAALSIIGELAR